MENISLKVSNPIMSTRHVYCVIFALTLLLYSCSSDTSVVTPTNSGNIDQEYDDSLIPPVIQPTGEVPDDLYQKSGIIQSNEYPPFTKKLTVNGMILVGRDEISDDFMENVARTIEEMFPQDEFIDTELQEGLITNLYRYKAVIPLFKDRRTLSSQEQPQFDDLTNQYSVVDVIYESEPGPRQVNEVMEHILHFVTRVGFHHTFPDEWGTSKTSDVYYAMQEAIDKGHYNVTQYNKLDSHYLRIIIQEFAYWVIFTAWDYMEPFGPDSEWTGIRNPTDVREKLPLSWQLFQQTVPNLMTPPFPSLLDELFGM